VNKREKLETTEFEELRLYAIMAIPATRRARENDLVMKSAVVGLLCIWLQRGAGAFVPRTKSVPAF
jgi:hypothetical protein